VTRRRSNETGTNSVNICVEDSAGCYGGPSVKFISRIILEGKLPRLRIVNRAILVVQKILVITGHKKRVSTYHGVMVANYPFIVIAEIFDGGTRIIEECGHDRKSEHDINAISD
jgi:hypothetical protein